MSNSPEPSLYSQIDVTGMVPSQAVSAGNSTGSSTSSTTNPALEQQRHAEMMAVLREILTQERLQTEILKQVVNALSMPQRQRMMELQTWRQQHPQLAEDCRQMLKVFSNVQSEYYARMLEEMSMDAENIQYNDFSFNDFVDRFGPRLAHLNGILQMLSQLAAPER